MKKAKEIFRNNSRCRHLMPHWVTHIVTRLLHFDKSFDNQSTNIWLNFVRTSINNKIKI